MRRKFSLYAFGAVLLMLCAPLRSQNFVNQELGVSMQFDGVPTLNQDLTGNGCTTYDAATKNLLERLEVCDFANIGAMSNDDVQEQFITAFKKSFNLKIDRASIAGEPGQTFAGNKIVDQGQGGWLWGEITNVRSGSGTRVYLVLVLQTQSIGDAGYSKMSDNALKFLNTLRILNPPHFAVSNTPPPAASTSPQAESATPQPVMSGAIAELNPPATDAEIALYNKLKANQPDDVDAFIKARKWFRQVYAVYPNPRAAGVDVRKWPTLPDDFKMDFALNADERFMAQEGMMMWSILP